MTKKQLNALLSVISCDDTQIVIHNFNDDSLFSLSITDEYEHTVKMTFSKQNGFLNATGDFNFKTLDTINLINEFIQSVNHADFRKNWRVINLNDAKKVRVYQLANKNQFVIEYYVNGELLTCFQSYYSLIAIYNRTTKELFINNNKWDYSKTTLKHLKMFINEWTPYTYENKQQFSHLIHLQSATFILFNEYE